MVDRSRVGVRWCWVRESEQSWTEPERAKGRKKGQRKRKLGGWIRKKDRKRRGVKEKKESEREREREREIGRVGDAYKEGNLGGTRHSGRSRKEKGKGGFEQSKELGVPIDVLRG